MADLWALPLKDIDVAHNASCRRWALSEEKQLSSGVQQLALMVQLQSKIRLSTALCRYG